MIRISTLALGIAILGASEPALAWKHEGVIYLPDDFPLKYYVADDGQPGDLDACDASGGTEQCAEESMPPGGSKIAADGGYQAWQTGASCAEFSVVDAGVCTNIGSALDGKLQITFNDPSDQNDPGTLAVTYYVGGSTVATIDGKSYAHFSTDDIVVSKNIAFTSNELIDKGQCQGQTYSLQSVLTHEEGHSLGMDHSCEDPNKPEKGGGPCPDPLLRDATMFWQSGPCDDHQSEINEDDIEGFDALYGPFATFTCSHEVSDGLAVGVVPFDLNCVIQSESISEVTGAQWNWGDGGTSTDINATHTYTKAGNYTIQLSVDGHRDSCQPDGTWTNSYRKIGYVRACDVPQASFELQHVDGLKYQMLNDSDVSVYGCLANIEWQVFKGSGTSGEPVIKGITAWEPIIEFPDAGTYTVVMNLGGIAGTGAAKITTDVRDYRGEGRGCSTTGADEAGLGVLMALGMLARRRRT